MTAPQHVVAFDFDGTLTDYLAADRAAIAAAQRLCAPAVAPTAFFVASGDAIMDFHQLVEEQRVDPSDMHRWRLAATCARFGLSAPGSEAVDEYARALVAHTVPAAHSATALGWLAGKGFRAAIITNAYDGAEQRRRIKAAFPQAEFASIIIAGEHGRPKPARDAFDALAHELQTPARDMIYVGDSPRYDVPGALAAGMRVIIVSESAAIRRRAHEMGADHVASLRDLPGLITPE